LNDRAPMLDSLMQSERRQSVSQHMQRTKPRRPKFLRTPLFRLLAINLGIGTALAVFLVGGLLWLNPGGLRHLIFTDRSPGVALGLLPFGFIVTFGSTAMGSAIMAMGQREADDDEPRGPKRLVPQEMGQTLQRRVCDRKATRGI
jgi:hypothetical protein